MMYKGECDCVSQRTSETPLARRALISSSLSSGQAVGEAEARATRQMARVVNQGRCMPKRSVQQAKKEQCNPEGNRMAVGKTKGTEAKDLI